MDKIFFVFTKDSFRVDIAAQNTNNENTGKFVKAPYQTFYRLAFSEKPDYFDAAGNYIYRIAELFSEQLAATPGIELSREKTVLTPDEETTELLLNSVPFVIGAEYVTKTWIKRQYKRFLDVFKKEIKTYPGKVSLYFAEKNSKLHVPERVFFHLVENKQGDYPFAFLATYATKTNNGSVRHVPLQYALTEYKGEKAKILDLLSCLNKAAEVSEIIGELMDSGELFHPLGLTAEEAYSLLKDIPALEDVGIRCRIPNWWKKRYSSVAVSVTVGDEKPKLMGLDSILSMTPSLTVGGIPLTEAEIKELLSQTEGLSFIKGRWIEVNHAQLNALLAELKKQENEITFLDALRADILRTPDEKSDNGVVITNGKWLMDFLKVLRDPKKIKNAPLPETFCGELRPYQQNGRNWLLQMNRIGFGACLADDMGLGKTVQILAFLENLRTEKPNAKVLLIVPASLLGNWKKESAKFTPDMTVDVLYGKHATDLSEVFKTSSDFLTITTYRMACSIESLYYREWDCVILDEAQAIKNPATKQTKQIKKLKSRMKIALTGTPIENELFNLWSVFDFLDKGLLGSSDEFRSFCRSLQEHPEGYSKLKNMIAPFMLRRVKTDKKIISDLPEKMEQADYIELSKKQAVLYRKLLAETENSLEESSGIQRKGLILALLLHLKQICNHPDQYLGQDEFDPSQSGKFEMLKEICQTIYEKRERVLVFTQFKEITGHLDKFLSEIFHCKGGVIHGGVSVNERSELVSRFQGEEYMPYMVLSVRAGGTGLNLTKANHVIHFDRWWNPSVENQATDRAFRIGQDKNVMVHKFICQGTVEEKIDALINSKKELAENVIGSGGESWITEMSNDELLSMLRLEV